MAGPQEEGWEVLFLKEKKTFLCYHTIIDFLHPRGMPTSYAKVPEVVATELRVEAVTVELLPRLRPRLLPLLRLEETLTTGGGAETVLDVVEKVLEEEWRFASLSTLVCFKRGEQWKRDEGNSN